MRNRFSQGIYEVQNTEKYVGNKRPTYRSSWERGFMHTLDHHPSVLEWASEPIKIPYVNPQTGRPANYIPDFLIKYTKADGSVVVDLIEIKPASQTHESRAKSKNDKTQQVINAAKWEAASNFSKMRGITFRILTEDQLFGKKNGTKRKKQGLG